MITDLFDVPTPIVQFDHLGRYVLPDPTTGEKKSWTRVTTFAKAIADTYHLEAWKRRQVALGLLGQRGLLTRVAESETKRELDTVVEEAMEAAGANEGRRHGTKMHSIIERINRGEHPDIPEYMADDVAAYQAELDKYGISIDPRHVERRIINTVYDLAGTFDALVTLPSWTPHLVFDLKTAEKMDHSWLETSIQLASYANTRHLLACSLDAFEEMPQVDLEVAIVAHLPAGQGKCELYEVDIARGWDYAALAADVRAARSSTRGLAVRYRPLT